MSAPNTHEKNRPAFIRGFMWFAFSGTAMLSAFILPIHIWALTHGYSTNLSNIIFRLYFLLLFVAALYHGLYRTKTILFDLGITKYQKQIGWLLISIFFIAIIKAAIVIFS